jgi:DNA-binding response OmpR family regulator
LSHPDRHSARLRESRAVVLASPTLAALIGLVMRHISLDTIATTSVRAARTLLGERPPLAIIETSLPYAETLLSTDDPPPTVALIDHEQGGSSFRAFAEGADQVIRIPFTPDELAVRSAALLRRRGELIGFSRTTHADGLALTLDERVFIHGQMVFIGATLNSLLYLLAARSPDAVSRDEIRRHVWGVDADASDSSVDQLARKLSRTLGDHDGQHFAVKLRQNGACLALVGSSDMSPTHDMRRDKNVHLKGEGPPLREP